ncbi:uncharacterized protein HKBW3S44_00618 [Candidatus Hakubella thermalkaliphila]|uniref:26 kDa periplasmic immunogenic protein n=1 Tax=Candidatus Hakubella thermalkaliphila TaxID=2754717 RepID=A0A6V8PXB4_9ACTN|nr:SIMPL domain-containing protein [Candidatus Hakubella thermalkaliphila]GFP30603.1 uncharacterized protein HKBW3S34_01523 [Candidatus Hakubella thermalkaliphila]GFP36937.1 uncharacterized protein HKBW3S44_00618 [Candidatus Hakubella thermalkaliphila]GFP38794.1 uncharacterized protein HKBW3S47_00495 [Candidatus Hakubella thermalkaliphila]
MSASKSWTAKFILIGLIFLLTLLVVGCVQQPKEAQEPTPLTQVPLTTQIPKTLTVSGEGRAIATPDVATVTIGVELQEKTPERAMNRNSEIMQKVIQAIREMGIPEEDITTVGVNLHPEYNYPQEGAPEIVGYYVSNQVIVTVREIQKVSDLIAKATKAGATSIYGVRFDVSPGNKAEMEALNDAYANAKTKAEALAAAMGVRLKEIYSARENGIPPIAPVYLDYYAVRAEGAGEVTPPPVVGQNIEITAAVEITYVIE